VVLLVVLLLGGVVGGVVWSWIPLVMTDDLYGQLSFVSHG
jgi:hypothetical protein